MSNKKRRTPEHTIADQSYVHLEKFVFKNKYTCERIFFDYGYDANIYTYNDLGELENGCIYIQLKARTNLSFIDNGNAIRIDVEIKDLRLWCEEPYPCILIVYHAKIRPKAYWFHIQTHEYCKALNTNGAKTLTIHIPTKNILDSKSILKFAKIKEKILKEFKKQINDG